MSEVKVNKITPRTNCGTTTLGDSGDTFNIPAGVTISNSGTATGFGATGAVSWEVASIKTTGFTATAGVGYFCDTTSGGFTVTLPASPTAGDVIGVADYAKTFDTDNLVLGRNSEKIGGVAENATLTTEGIAVTLVYVDTTKGWIVTDSGLASDAPTAAYIAATGGCITTCGNYKVHTFNSPGTFTVTAVGNACGSTEVSYVVVAGAGGGGGSAPSFYSAGGGGAGGFREGKTPQCSYTSSPLACTSGSNNGLPVSASPGSYPIVVGSGGGGGTGNPACGSRTNGGDGNVSSFDTITSAGGGGGGKSGGAPGATASSGQDGGSGGGGGGFNTVPDGAKGEGNQPPVSPPQGQDGGTGYGPGTGYGGGGGGAGGTGTSAPVTPGHGIPGGPGVASEINFSSVTRAAGGKSGECTGSSAGVGGCNTGDAGQGGNGPPGGAGGNGGSGIVIIRYKYQ
tara:strand:- start:30 stop:1391 length:1362 start_codon:yes stop_codon:yes gene_type:complete